MTLTDSPILLTLCVSALYGRAQDTTFKENVRLVEVYATAFDQRGRPVDGLAQDQFEILDDGKPEKIQRFEPTDGSLSCALLLDTTSSMGAVLPVLKNAARGLIDSLRPVDSVSIWACPLG